MDLLIIIALVWIIGLIGLRQWFRHSPFGWEDKDGFHYGEEPGDKNKTD